MRGCTTPRNPTDGRARAGSYGSPTDLTPRAEVTDPASDAPFGDRRTVPLGTSPLRIDSFRQTEGVADRPPVDRENDRRLVPRPVQQQTGTWRRLPLYANVYVATTQILPQSV